MIRNAFLACLLLTISLKFNAQELLLKSGTHTVDNIEEASITPHLDEVFEEQFFRIVVFNELPGKSEKEALRLKGITLLDYLPRNAFLASFMKETNSVNKSAYNIKKIINLKAEYKLSKSLLNNEFPKHARIRKNEVKVVGQYFSILKETAVREELEKNGFVIKDAQEERNYFLIQTDESRLEELYNMSCFQYFDIPAPEGKPENLPNRTEHRSNTLFTEVPNGLRYRGDGFKVMMQDDGRIGPHIDFEGRIDQSNCSSCSTDPSDNHGDHVAGTIMGAGNLDPKARGMAHGVELLVYNSWNSNYSAVPNLYQNENVYITSKSYSNGCNGGYTTLAQQLDNQVRTYSSLTHVFSAGNAGNDDCGYGAGAGWGNITGGHKSGKNVIAVGNLTNTSTLANSSSRGPATDGRIKPDICGVGTQVYSTIYDNNYANFTGTSMSCPGVAGTITQLYDAFQDLNGGTIPNSGLIKASVLNSADDLGNPGPDFKHGWGSINARRAFQIIENGTYIQGSVSNGQQNTHTITVPVGLKELRVMVYWTDYEGSTNSAIALVNDLNIVLEDPATTQYQPWVLDPSPSPAALNANAVRGMDNLNNMEQVTLQNPAAGSYTVQVDGFSIPQGPQEYFLVYYFEGDEITVTYPLGGEGLTPSTSEYIRWDAPEGTDPFTVSFSEDDGATWTVIGTAPGDERQLLWNIPAGTLTGLGRIKVERNAVFNSSENPFSVIDVPNGIGSEWVCPDSLMLSWNPVNGAIGYEVSKLGPKYMDSIAFVTDTNVVLIYPSTLDTWFSVKAYGLDNAIGERAVAYHKTSGEFGCNWSAPYAAFDIDCESAGEKYCFNLIDESVNTAAGSASITWYFPGGTPSTSTGSSPQVCYNVAGDYDVAMVVDNGYGVDSIYQSAFINVVPTSTIPYFEGFEAHSSFYNNEYWTSESLSGGSAKFQITTTTSLSGIKSAFLLNYGQPGGSVDELISGPIDLSVLQSSDDVTLSFRYAYRKRNANNEEWLRVLINSSCTDPWLTRKTIFGNVLSPLSSGSNWYPSSEEDWVTVHMTNITSSYFTENLRFKFQFESDEGNNIFLDNINLYKGAPSDEIVSLENHTNEAQDFIVFPNPASDELNLKFGRKEQGEVIVFITDLAGKRIAEHRIVSQAGENLVVMDTEEFAPGMYLVSLSQGGTVKTKKITVQ